MRKNESNDKLDDVRIISSDMLRCIDKSRICEINRLSGTDDRLFSYCDLLSKSCSRCFRAYLDGVYWFNGRYWVPLDKKDILLEMSTNSALSSIGVQNRDLFRGGKRLIKSIKDSSYMCPLDVSPVVVGFKNGVYDFTDIYHPVYHPYSDRMPILHVLPYEYDADATCPSWTSFLDMVLTKPQQLVLQKFLGLGCIDRKSLTHRIEETLWLVGDGGNGKSTIFEVVKSVYGFDNLSYMPLGHLVTTNVDLRMRNIGRIAGKIFNYCSEIQADDITRSSDTFKSLCSGEPQEVRSIAKDSWTVYDIPFFIFNMNKMPVNRSMDRAFIRRLLVIDFNTTVRKEDMDRELPSRLMQELPGIRNWCIEGFKKLVEDNYSFGVSNRDMETLRQYEFENGQSVKLFCDDNGYRSRRYAGKWEEKPHYVPSYILHRMYCEYCARYSQEAMSENAFGRAMSALRFSKKKYSGMIVYTVYSDEYIGGELEVK